MRIVKRAWLVVLVAACGAGDGVAGTPGEPLRRLESGDSLPNLTRPAAYAGPLPCADCSGIETTLLLHPDGSYRIRERYVGEDAPNDFARIGRWTLRGDSVPILTLFTDAGARYFALTDPLTLTALDLEARPIAGSAPTTLTRVVAPSVIEGQLRVRGEFRYAADAATLVECVGGRQFAVGGDSAFVRLQRAYREASLGAGASVIVDITGRLDARAGGEAGQRPETVVVDSFAVQGPRAACEASRVRALIAVGDWQLTTLGADTLPELTRELQPTLRFVLSEPTMFGNASCNRFTGRAVLRGLDLVGAPLASTRRLCVDSTANQRESRYLSALSGGGWFRAEGTVIVLTRGGTELARFRRR